MNVVKANDLKVKGVSSIETSLNSQEEAVITVRGEEKFVVMTMNQYHYLREKELEAAVFESKQDLRDSKYEQGSVEDHLSRIKS